MEPRTKCFSWSLIPVLLPYQCIEIISEESAIMDDVSLEDNKEE